MQYRAICPPEWLSHSAVYQINPRTFSPEGTLAAVTHALPALRELGFRVMYLCPIFEEDPSENQDYWSERQKRSATGNPKNPYRMNNYFRIDPEYGTEEDLRTFIDTAHALGMRVLLDLVYLHIGPEAPILQKHPEFARQDKNGNIVYTAWHFPYLDFRSAGLREYLWCNMVYFIGELDADGFRCDVGDGVPLDFWVEARRRMRAVKPDAVLINEGQNWDYLVTGFDSSYCFAWHELLYRVISGEKTAADLRAFREELDSRLPAGTRLLQDMENHDTVTDWPERAECRAGHDGMEEIQVLNYLLRGIPMVYCGNELADTAHLSMFANRFHPGVFETTDRTKATQEPALRRQAVMRTLNALKKDSVVLCDGETEWLDHSAPEQVLAFRRTAGERSIVFVGNLSAQPVTVQVRESAGGTVLLQNGVRNVTGAPDGRTLTLERYGYLVTETV